MTDNEIIKSLKLHMIDDDHICGECVYCSCGCSYALCTDVLNLINRLQAENEQLTEKCNCQQTVYADLSKIIKEQKAEMERLEKVQVQYVKAYFDEFTERLKSDFSLSSSTIDTVIYEIVDELTETMKKEFGTLADFTDLIKSEAIKEFAERLKFIIVNKPSEFTAEKGTVDFLNGLTHRQHEILDNIDNLVKEMIGE